VLLAIGELQLRCLISTDTACGAEAAAFSVVLLVGGLVWLGIALLLSRRTVSDRTGTRPSAGSPVPARWGAPAVTAKEGRAAPEAIDPDLDAKAISWDDDPGGGAAEGSGAVGRSPVHHG